MEFYNELKSKQTSIHDRLSYFLALIGAYKDKNERMSKSNLLSV